MTMIYRYNHSKSRTSATSIYGSNIGWREQKTTKERKISRVRISNNDSWEQPIIKSASSVVQKKISISGYNILKKMSEINTKNILLKSFNVLAELFSNEFMYVNEEYGFYISASNEAELVDKIEDEYAYLFDEFYFKNYERTASAQKLVEYLDTLVLSDDN